LSCQATRYLLAGALLSAAACSAAPPPESTPTLDYLERGGELTIAFAREVPPFSVEAADGSPAGFEAELARAVAASLDADVSFLAVRSARLAIEQGAAALAFGAVEAEEGGVRPWFLDGVHVLGRTGGQSDVRDRIVAVLDPASEEVVLHAGGAPLRVDSPAIGLEAVQDGRVDLLAADLGTLAAILEPGVEIGATRLSSAPYGILTQPGQPDLVRVVDELVATACENGVWADAYLEWITPLTRLEPPPCPAPA
jgi:ABC-type amino acid transport substrate-binding protein